MASCTTSEIFMHGTVITYIANRQTLGGRSWPALVLSPADVIESISQIGPGILDSRNEQIRSSYQRSVAIGRRLEVKTTNSNRRLQVHPNLADPLLECKTETSPRDGNCGRLFPSHMGQEIAGGMVLPKRIAG